MFRVEPPLRSGDARLISCCQGVMLSVREIWEHREVCLFLIWRDIKVRYKQSLIGVAWTLLQPLLLMIVFTLFLGRWGGLEFDTVVPYPLFCYAGILPWQLFSHALLSVSTSLVADQELMRKVYFPKILIPLASLSVGLINLCVAILSLVVLMMVYRAAPPPQAVLAPLFLLLVACISFAVGSLFSAINVRYRDVQLAMPFLAQLGLFLTPVFYSSQLVPAPWRPWLALNPMVGAINGFRWALLGDPTFDAWSIGLSLGMMCLLSGLAAWIFTRLQETMIDVI